MILTRTPSPLHPSRLNTAIALLLVFISLVRGFPLNGQQLDSAVEGVQKYLESSGFPKMTRGEVLDFLNDFSKNSRVSRSDNNALNVKKDITSYVTPQPDFEYSKTQMPHIPNDATENKTPAPKIPNGESPLNYGYPMSLNKQTDQPPPSSTPTIFVTVQDGNLTSDKRTEIMLQAMQGRNAQKKNIGPSVDLNAYTKFKKIPEARNLKIDDDMKDFLNNFGLLDTPKSGKSIDLKPNEPLRRNDDAAVTETVDEKLLKSILAETGNSGVNISEFQPLLESASTSRDHVFNPSDSNVKTVDINRIAKIVANIRLLTDDNNTVSLSQDAIQKKLENITEAISAIDQPTDNNSAFNGYEVFFDDNSKEVDSDLPASQFVPVTQTLTQAQNLPDPLSTDELQMLLEKNKNDVKRQEPANDTSVANISTSTEESIPVATSSETVVTSAVTDSSSEATSIEVTSGASAPRDSSTVADTNPSLSQLAESFGGGETASNPPPAIDELINTPSPGRPKNGLYFYVDWNSFLTVNGGQKNQVNLRFAPKAGNPNHFIKVNVP